MGHKRTLGDALDAWLRAIKDQRSHDEYERRMRLYVRPTFDRTPLVKITKPMLIDVRTSLKEREEPIGNATIVFEEYDLPTLRALDGIAKVGPFQAAWVRDPDGNFLGIHDSPRYHLDAERFTFADARCARNVQVATRAHRDRRRRLHDVLIEGNLRIAEKSGSSCEFPFQPRTRCKPIVLDEKGDMTNDESSAGGTGLLSKVPQVTVFFWIIKVLCTTVGETASDFLSENIGLGLNRTSMIAGALLLVVLVLQFRARKYIPALYWLVVVLVSVFGTLITDILTDGLKFPLEASTIIFSGLLALTFAAWYAKERTLSIHSIYTRRREAFYWLAILFTFALGTATGDLVAEKLAVGYLNTGLIVLGIIAAAGIAWRAGLNAVLAFWIAYILTRPLGASLGDYLSQPRANGGLGLGATYTSAVFLSAILAVVVYLAVTHKDRIDEPDAPEPAEQKGRAALVQVAVVVGLLLGVGIPGYYLRSAQLQRRADQASSAAHPLGDLSTFRTITQDMIGAVGSGNWTAAESSADELERSWDDAQAMLQRMNPDQWTVMDNAIDAVLKSTRSSAKDAAATGAALRTLAGVIDSLDPLPGASAASRVPQPAPTAIDAGVASPPVTPSSTASPDRPLGDLSKFRTIAQDMIGLVHSGDWAHATSRAKDLESAWDDAQATLQPMSPAKWTLVDGAIDDVLKKTRSSAKDAAATGASLQALVTVIDSLDHTK